MKDDDIVKRLLVRWEARPRASAYKINEMIMEAKEAAAEIESLRAEVCRLLSEQPDQPKRFTRESEK